MSKRSNGVIVLLKKLIPLCLVAAVFILNTDKINAQSQEEILVVADEMPSFPGGQKALMDAIYKNVTYPQEAIDKGIQGKVIARFVVTKDGSITQPSISKGLSPSIDKIVLTAISKLPAFIPGKKDGKPANVWFAVPVTFKID